MRTTVTLDPDTAAIIRRRMCERSISFKQALNDAIRAGAGEDGHVPFQTATVALGVPTVNLDRALQLAAELEDEELIRKTRVGKSRVVDANVLLYAVNESAEHHDEAHRWLDGALNGRATVGFSWISLLAFVRLSTKIGLFAAPLTVKDALGQVRDWLAQPVSVVLEPSPRHLDVLAGLLGPLGAGGNLTSDAHLAALAIEHRGEVVTYDSDFGRFPGVVWSAPTAV